MKYTIINAYGHSNRGDSVLLTECIEEVLSFDESAEISVLLFEGNAEHERVNSFERIGNINVKGLVGKLAQVYILTIALAYAVTGCNFFLKMLPFSQCLSLKEMEKSDFVISAPGGYIHDTNHAYIIALLNIFIAWLMGRKVLMAPQSYGPLKSKFSRFFTGYVLNKVDKVCARESYSYDFLINKVFVEREKVIKTGDSAFWNDHPDDGEKESVDDNSEILGVTVVGWTFPDCDDANKKYKVYCESLAHILDRAIDELGASVVIYNQVDDDIATAEFVRSLCKRKDRVLVDISPKSSNKLRKIIATSKVFLGTRFHSCIFAMMSGRPTFAISYLPKTEFIMKDLGLGHRSWSINDMDVEYIYGCVSSDWNKNHDAELEIKNAVARYREVNLSFSDVISSVE
ncbi:polysaccharide pyruvyl transferase family protein [Parathalassolituus penaei]|uniref:Polysaccharide pyruvyl transferase family protein n=1 Tax=Parathalassolituus penaei TaxID=2997323 RepID=A0A9X3EQD0_9GAMM|nr:polysaccharide pyruvyl transferase family protein [Parathalassolituus penaei]MCY0966943.1 polysaccharide pyruvyl transferase family protein [Parathalassolituus penaei]